MPERREPRISLNQLTEYLTATPAQRKHIIEQQKHPNDFQVIYYHEAQDAIQRFVAEGMSNEELLVSAVDDLYSRSWANQYQKTRNVSNAEAIVSFLEFYENLSLADLQPAAAPDDQPKLRVGRLDISIRPEILLRGDNNRYGATVGAIKLYFGKLKKDRLNGDSAKYPSTVLYTYLVQRIPDRKPLHQACIVIDVFGQSLFSAPHSHKRVFAEVKVACEEIAIWWDHV